MMGYYVKFDSSVSNGIIICRRGLKLAHCGPFLYDHGAQIDLNPQSIHPGRLIQVHLPILELPHESKKTLYSCPKLCQCWLDFQIFFHQQKDQ